MATVHRRLSWASALGGEGSAVRIRLLACTPLFLGLGECRPSCFRLVHRNTQASEGMGEGLSSCWVNNDSKQGGCR